MHETRESRLSRFVALFAALALSSCTQNRFGDDTTDLPAASVTGLGSKAWASENVACGNDAECAAGETCIGGVCQMQRCTKQAYESVAPLGQHRFLALYRDLLVADDTDTVRGYEPVQSALVHADANSWQPAGGGIADVAGGNFFGARPEALATAHRGTSSVRVLLPSGEARQLDAGFEPQAIAAGDVDADGVDERIGRVMTLPRPAPPTRAINARLRPDRIPALS